MTFDLDSGDAADGEVTHPSRDFARHERWLRLVVYARVGEINAVDEVMQEVALAVIKSRGGAVPPDRISAWLYRIAVRQSLLHRRRGGRQRRLLDRLKQHATNGAHCDGDALSWLLARERGALVRDAIHRLPPRDAEVLLLKYAENWTAKAIAHHLGASVSAVEARLNRARQKLRSLLARSDVIEPHLNCIQS